MEELLAMARESGDEKQKAAALRGYIRMIGMKRAAGLEPAEAVALYEMAIDTAEGDEERALALQGMAKAVDLKALEFLRGYIEELVAFEDKAVLPQAETAYVDIAIALRKNHPQEAKAALEQFCGASKNKELIERATAAVQEIK